ncbi:hypothetical protein JIN84_07830 [Luteolibacter yonseiensis]|uniref:Secreted protein n=1 Tax=Luteolibacter yonseiensis TaxID=1144680 RepID=A0A934R2A2_9BACT|nr:hypothetical protein [Luteolibacter yonseiensis]MBK1815519.1 hypothetical protein [Luteolibacter yonseiensis]
MNRRHLLKSLVLTALGSSLIAPGSSAATPTPEKTGKNKPLKVGETLHFDKDLSIKFLSVKKDHRCPINARCITAGDAEVLLRVKVGSGKPRIVSLHTDEEPNSHVFAVKYPKGTMGIPKSYLVSIGSLNPLPYAGRKTRQSDYRLRLAISTAV